SFVVFVACGPGNGVALGTAGRAKTPRAAGTVLTGAEGTSEVVVVSVAGFAALSSFCCATSGTARNTPRAAAAHHLRINILPKFFVKTFRSFSHPPPADKLRIKWSGAAQTLSRCAQQGPHNPLPWPRICLWRTSSKRQSAVPIAYSKLPRFRKQILASTGFPEPEDARKKIDKLLTG